MYRLINQVIDPNYTRVKAVFLGVVFIVLSWGILYENTHAQVLNETCTATALNISTQVSPNGTFSFNAPLPDGKYRIRIICRGENGPIFAQSGFLDGVSGGLTEIGDIEFIPTPLVPENIAISAERSLLDFPNFVSQLTVTGSLSDGTFIDLTKATTGTFYVSSNPGIALVSPDGFVIGFKSGSVLIMASNQGTVATIPIQVVLSDDKDGDGMPDDYEVANAINPGGANLALQAGTTAIASSSLAGSSPASVVDGDRATSWYANTGDAANLGGQPIIEVTLPADGNVAQVRLLGNTSAGYDFIAGVVQGYDAGGNQIFNSGEVFLPEPTRDLSVPVDVDGIRKIRFTDHRRN